MSQKLYSLSKQQRFMSPSWINDGVLYEVNIRQYTPEGTIKAFIPHLDRLHAMGVSVLWLMPVYPIGRERRKGTLGSYYSVADYTDVNPEFGTVEDLRDLVDSAHSKGMHVILDWVANHSSRDNRWTTEHPDWYEWDDTLGELKTPFDWSDTAKLNYNSKEMRAGMVDAMKFWLGELDVDGFRYDMAMLVPDDFWYDALFELKSVKDDIFFLAEAEGEKFHRLGFHATYSWEIHHAMVDVASGRKSANVIVDMLGNEAVCYPQTAIRMRFTSNHDEDSHSGSAVERFGKSLRAFSVMTFFLPGIPMIYSGEESMNEQRLSFFDKDAVNWKNYENADLYRELSALRKENPALRSDSGDLETVDSSSESPNMLSLKRKVGSHVVIALFNLSSRDIWTRFYDCDFCGEYSQIGSKEKASLYCDRDFYLPPWGCFMYYK